MTRRFIYAGMTRTGSVPQLSVVAKGEFGLDAVMPNQGDRIMLPCRDGVHEHGHLYVIEMRTLYPCFDKGEEVWVFVLTRISEILDTALIKAFKALVEDGVDDAVIDLPAPELISDQPASDPSKLN